MDFQAPSAAAYVLLGAALYDLKEHHRSAGMKYFRIGSKIARALLESPDYQKTLETSNKSNYLVPASPLSQLVNRAQGLADATQ